MHAEARGKAGYATEASGQEVMRQDIWTFSGFGELLCIVLAWTVGIAALWADSAADSNSPPGGKVAVSGDRTATSAYYD